MLQAENYITRTRVSVNKATDLSNLNQGGVEKLFNISFNQPKNQGLVIKFPEKNLVATYTGRMNVLRFIAICSIVWCHNMGTFESLVFASPASQLLQSAMMELGRIGTVIFFLISGFFLADKLPRYNITQYLRYRLFTLIIPWLIFLTLFVSIQMMHILSFKQFTQQNALTTLTLFASLFQAFIFHAAYWFIPVAVLSGCLLIIFKNHLNRASFIISLSAISLFYGINLYYGWVSTNHTRAFLGYVFFMWLGVQVRYQIQKVYLILQTVPWTLLLPLLAVLFIAACLESSHLKVIASGDAYASIRISNWLLSTGIFFAFLKSNTMSWISYLKPQRYVYIVYLVHSIIIAELAPFFNQFITQRNAYQFFPRLMSFQCTAFIVIMGLSYLIAVFIKNSPARYLTGVRR